MNRWQGIFGLILVAASTWASAVAPPNGPSGSMDFRYGVKIPMRDGVELNANVFLPRGRMEPVPVVFAYTPYTADRAHVEDCIYYARSGYVCAIVDARGRGDSAGKFVPFENDGRDGYDVVEWLARQTWSNGKVGMFGGSYGGFNQWATLKQFPPHLATIVPSAAAYPGYDFPLWPGNLFNTWDMLWLTVVSGAAVNLNLATNQDFTLDNQQALYQSGYPFARLDEVSGNLTTAFQKWMEHPYQDAYWNALVPAIEDYRRIDIPVLTVTGDYDADQAGALHYYRQLMAYGSPANTARHYLVIGPWNHAQTRIPDVNVEGLKFAPASLVDIHLLHKQWFDWVMKGGAKPEFLKQPVAYYVGGLEQWKYADRFEDVGAKSRSFVLSSGGRADDAFHSGTLGDSDAGGAAFDAYVYDPHNFEPYAPQQARQYAFDCSTGGEDKDLTNPCDAMSLQGNGLVYHSAPLGEEMEFSGSMKLTLWLEMDVPDTDFAASVDEIRMDGSVIHLTDTTQRARYRLSRSGPQLVEAGKVLRYELSTFRFNARRILKGSRLRLTLMPPTPDFERNYGSGKAVEHETVQDARVAHIRLYHDKRHRSTLEVPVTAIEPN